MKRTPLTCSASPQLLLMVDTFPRVGDRMADKLTLNYKHFVECHWQIRVYCFACKATVCLNSTKNGHDAEWFHLLCAEYQRTCTQWVHFHGRNQPRAKEACFWLRYHWSRSRRACQGLCRYCQGSSEHRVILLSLAVCYLSFHWLEWGTRAGGAVGWGGVVLMRALGDMKSRKRELGSLLVLELGA